MWSEKNALDDTMPREKWQKGLPEIIEVAGDFKITGKEEWLNDVRVIE